MVPRDLPMPAQRTAEEILENDRNVQPIPDDVRQYLVDHLQDHMQIRRILADVREFGDNWRNFYSGGFELERAREIGDTCSAFKLAAEQHLANLRAIDLWIDHVTPPEFEAWTTHVKNVTAEQMNWVGRIARLAESFRQDWLVLEDLSEH